MGRCALLGSGLAHIVGRGSAGGGGRGRGLRALTVAAALLAVTAPWSVRAQIADYQPPELEGVGVDEHLEETLPLELTFVDENGREVRLGEYFQSERPVLLTLNYYGCPMLCGLHLNGLLDGLRQVDWTPGQEFEMVTVSINPRETPTLAKLKKQNYIKEYGRPAAATGWHFLTGREAAIETLAGAVGFRYQYLEDTKEYSHAAVTMVVTPEGVLSRYLYGIVYEPQTLRYSLLEAAAGNIGSTLDKIILYCFRYDAAKGRYAPVAFKIMQIGAGFTAVILGAVLLTLYLRDARKRRAIAAGV